MSSKVYYNENEPFAVEWLRNLIAAGLIAPGDVDSRSIREVKADELRGYSQCHFFAGIGVWSHALRNVGWEDSRPVWTGSCPCQPFSAAGQQLGTADERHLWPVLGSLIAECRPAVVFGEQVASAAGRDWLATVRADLEAMDYAVGAADLCAAGTGAPHIRQRLYWVADATSSGLTGTGGSGSAQELGTAERCVPGRPSTPDGFWSAPDWLWCRDGKWRPVEPGAFPLAHGVANRVGRLRAYGNAIVPQVAEAFVRAWLDCRP